MCVTFTSMAFPHDEILGRVIDASNNLPLKGAAINIVGTTRGGLSETDGTFQISVQGATSVKLRISFSGYETQTIVLSDSTYDKIAGLLIALEPAGEVMKEVVVNTVGRSLESISGVYITQKNSASISDGISSDIIKKSPDRSTGEVLKRVSGTTIQDNKFVIIRGLSDRYNLGLSDGSLLPSTEPNRKAFSFDIIPASMIDNIIITKSGTPDLPADFAGGVINILTKEVPTRKFMEFSIGTGLNTVSTFKDFKSGYRSNTDFLGFDDGSRQLPKDFPSIADINNKQLTREQINNALNSLTNDFRIRTRTALPQISLQANTGDLRIFETGNKFGYTAGITYNRSENIRPNILRQYDNYDQIDNNYITNVNLGALLNLSYQTNTGKYSLKNIYNRVFDDNFLYREGLNISWSADEKFYAFDLLQKSLMKTTFKGENLLKDKFELNYLLSFNLITNNQPDQRKVGYTRPANTNTPYAAGLGSLNRINNRLFGDLNEKIYNAIVDLKMPINLLVNSSMKFGGFFAYRDRSDKNRLIGPIIDLGRSGYEEILQSPIESLFNKNYIDQGYYDLGDVTSLNDSYAATGLNAAGYVMFDNKISEKLRLVWGARYEYYKLNVKSAAITFNKPWNDILPSANLTYNLTPRANIRGSYFRSLVRPEFREISPLYYYDFQRNSTVAGNPDLNRSQINNFDLKYEWFPTPGEIISASVFYKYFKNTLETSIYAGNSSLQIETQNFPSATNVGVEVEVRKRFDFIAEQLKRLEFYTNIAITQSKVKFKEPLNMPNGKVITERPLTGQSPYTINAGLGYNTRNNQFSANIYYNRIGQRIDLVGGQGNGMVYEMPRDLLDLQIAYNITSKSNLKLNVKDILNTKVLFYFDQNINGKFDGSSFVNGINKQDKDWIMAQYKPGTNISLSYTYRF